ncbi:aminotransferase class I/II-fold pyridoxal phosphate-dependent enzyme, partial [Erysipelothrix rhusiopathiae]|nr:aminotransferase class I/II-fold pyridoxal phosphate-dependent enzyme [Erysipelothrix rhusiopathiae]
CSPHNPVGRVWSHHELSRIEAICAKHNVLVFADEIHGDLIMPYLHKMSKKKHVVLLWIPSLKKPLIWLKARKRH